MKKIYSTLDTIKYESPMLVEIAFESEGILCGSTDIDSDHEESEWGGDLG